MKLPNWISLSLALLTCGPLALAQRLSELSPANALTGAEIVPVVQDNSTRRTTLNAITTFSLSGLGDLAVLDTVGDADITGVAWGKITGEPTTLSGYGITDAQPAIGLASPPASPTSTGTAGTIIASGNYLYVCIATNTWRRAQLLTW